MFSIYLLQNWFTQKTTYVDVWPLGLWRKRCMKNTCSALAWNNHANAGVGKHTTLMLKIKPYYNIVIKWSMYASWFFNYLNHSLRCPTPSQIRSSNICFLNTGGLNLAAKQFAAILRSVTGRVAALRCAQRWTVFWTDARFLFFSWHWPHVWIRANTSLVLATGYKHISLQNHTLTTGSSGCIPAYQC